MKKKSSTTLALSAALLALMLTASACSDNNGNAGTTASGTPAVTASASPDASQSADPANPNAEANEMTGEYVGLVDGHSIEIKTESGPTVFQVGPEISDKVDPWEEGTKVKFKFTEETLDVNGDKVKQYTIQSIDKE